MKVFRSAKWISLLLPLQFAITSILAIYIGEPSARVFIAPEKLLPVGTGIGILSICFTGLALLIARDTHLASIYSSLAIISIFFMWKTFLVVVIAATLGWFLLRWLIKADAIPGIVLILESISAASLVFYLVQAIPILQTQPVSNPVEMAEIHTASGSGSELPDIYYIILDGYGRADVLSSIHGFDNSEFIHALEKGS